MSGSDVDLLIADDDDQIVSILQFLFEREGYNIEVAENGRQVKEYIAVNSAPKLVLLDVMMPYADGYELMDIMRTTDGWRDVPVIMLTAKSREEDIVKGLEKGVTEYVNKPFQPVEVVARVKFLLQKNV